MRIRLAIASALALLGGTSAYSADVQYNPAESNYDYCLELAQDEAKANIGMMYLRPAIIDGDQQALTDKQELKQHKHLAQREQRKEKCI